MKLPNLSWSDKFALIDKYSPSDELVCKTFKVSLDEFNTAKNLRQSGTIQSNKQLNTAKYGNIFTNTDNSDNSTVHQYPQTATKRTVQKIPQKRGRKGDKIITALKSVPTTPTSVELFSKTHEISVAVLRQSKRFTAKLDESTVSAIG